MIKLVLIAFALGIASLDVTTALFVAGALGAGARTRTLILFGGVAITGTVAFGVALSLVVGPRLAGMSWSQFLPKDPTEFRIAALAQVILGVALLVWGFLRAVRPSVKAPKPGVPRGLGAVYLAGAGVVFAFAAILDPTFVSLVVIAGRFGEFLPVLAAHITWTLVSHAPLILIMVFILSRFRERGVQWFQGTWSRARPVVDRIATVAVFVAGVLLLFDAGWWYVTGRFLIPE